MGDITTVTTNTVATTDVFFKELKGHTKPVSSIAISPDGKYMVSGSDDKTINVWDWYAIISTTANVSFIKMEGHTASVYSVVISQDGKYVVSGSEDETIKVWDMTTYKMLKELRTEHDSI